MGRRDGLASMVAVLRYWNADSGERIRATFPEVRRGAREPH